jgi:D-aminopeptidase
MMRPSLSLKIFIGIFPVLAICFSSQPQLQMASSSQNQSTPPSTRQRARELGIKIGILPTGELNAITDVAGVLVGHTTLNRGDNIRTGVTAVLPHNGNIFREKVPGAVFVGNGFGKLAGSTQVDELGEIETPILLTSTLNVPRVADALLDYMLALPGNEDVQSINPLVGETNDGYLNDIRGRNVTRDDVLSAIKNAKAGIVEEGSVGAGTGHCGLWLQRWDWNFVTKAAP